jgi:antitoxin ParD1/3/4
MRTNQALSITLPHDMAQMVKSKVQSGEYATESEVIQDGLQALAARDAALEVWLADEVLPTLEAIKAHPEQLLDADKAWAQLSAHITK